MIGGRLVKRLLNDGYSVRVLDNHSRGTLTHISDFINDIEFINSLPAINLTNYILFCIILQQIKDVK